jgi:DNA-binding XRE family transcriptional regulator
MITINFNPIIKAIEKSGMKKKDIAKHAETKQDTLYHFLRSGKKIKQQIKVINKLCELFNLNWRDVIK